jgi:acyl-CoA thioester hydrolase
MNQVNPTAPGEAAATASVMTLRVRYSEIDQLGTFYNSRALEWFECARTETMRAMGLPYTEWERRGVRLPLVEAHVQYRGRAAYDDLLRLSTTLSMSGRASLRFDVHIQQADSGAPVAVGYTIHALTDAAGRAMRPPQWVIELVAQCGAVTKEKA